MPDGPCLLDQRLTARRYRVCSCVADLFAGPVLRVRPAAENPTALRGIGDLKTQGWVCYSPTANVATWNGPSVAGFPPSVRPGADREFTAGLGWLPLGFGPYQQRRGLIGLAQASRDKLFWYELFLEGLDARIAVVAAKSFLCGPVVCECSNRSLGAEGENIQPHWEQDHPAK
jgi:hypothetical protein